MIEASQAVAHTFRVARCEVDFSLLDCQETCQERWAFLVGVPVTRVV